MNIAFSLKENRSEADFATRHGVAQLRFIVDERHNSQVGLDEQGSFQDQDTVGTAGDGLLLVGFFHCLHQLGSEVIQLGKEEENKKQNKKLFLYTF